MRNLIVTRDIDSIRKTSPLQFEKYQNKHIQQSGPTNFETREQKYIKTLDYLLIEKASHQPVNHKFNTEVSVL